MKHKKAPPIDIRKVIRAAAEAALEDPPADAKPKKHGLSSGRAIIVGAGLVTVGRMLARGRGGDVLASLQDHLGNLGVQLPGNDEEPDIVDDVELDEIDDDPEADERLEPELEDEEPDDEEADPDDDLEAEHAANGGAPERPRRRQTPRRPQR